MDEFTIHCRCLHKKENETHARENVGVERELTSLTVCVYCIGHNLSLGTEDTHTRLTIISCEPLSCSFVSSKLFTSATLIYTRADNYSFISTKMFVSGLM